VTRPAAVKAGARRSPGGPLNRYTEGSCRSPTPDRSAFDFGALAAQARVALVDAGTGIGNTNPLERVGFLFFGGRDDHLDAAARDA
jgi:hypothetical protein